MVPYGGSHWWSLSHDAVSYVLRYVRERPGFARFYRNTHCPSEMFFQTILLNSDLASRVKNYERYNQWSATTTREDKSREDLMIPEDSFNLRYMDWSIERTGGLGRPAVLTEVDFERLKESEGFFARKFDEQKSAALLTMIDELLRRDGAVQVHANNVDPGVNATN